MALPPKKNIDFDVYERQDPTSTVDWAGAAADITKTFATIRDTRQARKDDLEKNITEQETALNDIGEYDSPTLRQVALDSSQQSADELARKADLMRRGLLKPNDMMKFKSNQSSGWTQFKNNAENWNSKYVEYTERMNAVPPVSAKLEQQLAQSLEGFGNLKNLKFLTDDDGNMSYTRIDDKGEIIPGESMSANEMTNLLNQKIDNFDSVGTAKNLADKIGIIIKEKLNKDGIVTSVNSVERSRAESTYLGSDEMQETLDLYAKELTAVPQNLAVMLTQNVNVPGGAEVYQGDFGGKLHDAWAADPANSDKPAGENPYIAMRFDGNNYLPDVTPEQKAVADEYARGLVRSSLNIKETVKDVKKIQKTPAPQQSASSIAKGEKDDAKSSKLGDYITMLTDEDPVKREAIEKTLRTTRNDAISAFNAKVSNDEDKLPLISDITKGTTSVATQEDVDQGLAEKIGDEVIKNREIILSNGRKIPIQGSFTEQTRILEAVYDPDNQLTTDDIEKLAKGRGFDLDTEITSTGDGGKTSKAAYTTPNYKTDLQIKGKDSAMSAKDYLDAEYGYGSGAEFNTSADTTKGIGEGMINLINASLDPAMLAEFNKTPGMELSMTFDKTVGNNSVTFNFGGESYTIGGENGDLFKDGLYSGNGYEVWQALQDNLLNPAINKLNKERTGGGGGGGELD